ncbi:HEAT repeat domain-containing protein [Aetokthonos hydrillicola Thurmond2011]|jgi:HEAT repeat protein|uniref:HEAT repeat domain-containing protein n=1 Tax=Aetokthonos hydrillicola Thurmond2011 TaxID=2712845 RepID=A0AAP5IDI8_9CYAN|nr:HEAT repeat domain-containing protein [Aetokthonos hydrillicola]MBO3458092.1 HEAT repeat domain-containing protein [Aetokthonos hydrillicola CCALA 1050]MBW4587071.1 HEAT repeat domain-containing protein [Aetokthonos hydrillicola CCALA 1050]MDR9899680.1 HEAT repeat domain-containing protein [Aetokthonos hydrillicola Thurmond2011]
MYDEDDISLLENEEELDSPLDHLAPITAELEVPKPDPEEMLALLENPEPQQRMLAARAFCDIEDARATPHLIRLLADTCPLVRVSAAYGIGRNPSVDAVEPLINQLNQDWNGYVRKGVVWALGNCRDQRCLAPLADALKTDISAVRLWAASALAQMAQVNYETVVKAIPPLIQALVQDPISAVRSNCAWSIGQLCRELPSNVVYATALDALIQAFAEDKDLGVREDAKAAILGVGDPRGLQLIETLELEGWF